MSNFKLNVIKNTKGFSRNFSELKKPVLRSILQGEYIIFLKIKTMTKVFNKFKYFRYCILH